MQTIIATLERFLRNSRIHDVRFAQGRLPPPELAYTVNFPRIAVTLSGRDVVELESNGGREIASLPSGSALVIPPNCWNRPRWTHRATVLNLLFGKKQAGVSLVVHDGRSLTPKRGHKAVLRGPAGDTVHNRILQALLGAQDRPAPAPALVEALLAGVLDSLKFPARTPARKAAITYEAVCLYLQENFSFPLSRDAVAAHFHLSPNHISRLFLREGLIGFSDYLNRVRINRAKYLLRNHPLRLDEIAAKCGYSDTSYFCRVFKRQTKLTPSGYASLTRVTE